MNWITLLAFMVAALALLVSLLARRVARLERQLNDRHYKENR